MGTITVTEPTSATQMARWDHAESNGTAYVAYVALTSHRDGYGKRGWAYYLGVSVPDGVGFGHTFAAPADLLYCHDAEPADVLESLSSFVGAWAEAQGYPNSDNRDMFPASCLPFAAVAEEFTLDAMREEV